MGDESYNPYAALSASVIISALDDLFSINECPSALRAKIIKEIKRKRFSSKHLRKMNAYCHHAELAEHFLLRDTDRYIFFLQYCRHQR